MIYGKYKFKCSILDTTVLPHYKGSTFRGIFGWALKGVVCALKRQDCADCLLKQRCVYALVFETPLALQAIEGSRVAAPPHPFIIEPPLTTKEVYKSGEIFDFNLILFGEINNSLPYFIYAFEQIGNKGIGKKNNGKRGTFTLKEVSCNDRIIYNSDHKKLQTTAFFENMSLKNPDVYPDKNVLKITIVTPLRLKYESRLNVDIPFHIFVRAMLRRVSVLSTYYGQGEPDLDYNGLARRAFDIKIIEKDLKWFDWKRYSTRQDQGMLMGGITGSVTYEGNIREFMPLVDFCQKVHLGKQTAFGLGKISAEYL